MTVDKINQIGDKYGKKIAILTVVAVIGIIVFSYFSREKPLSGTEQPSETGVQNLELTEEPDRDADIYGMITSVKGNQITILKFDPSTMPGAKENGIAKETEESSGENAISLGTSSSMPSGGPGGNGGMPGNGSRDGGGGMPGGFGGSSSSTREEKLEELKKTSIGTETITVPVGISILVQSTASDGQSSVEMGNLKDLTSDTVVVLWLKESEDNENAESGAVKNSGNGTEAENSEQHIAEFINVTGKVDMDN